MRKFTIFLALMFFIGLQVANAQRSISGKVTSSDDGSGIPGATVLVKGTAVGAITDVDGKFTLNVPKDKNFLLVSYVGMKTQEVELGTDNVVNVVLQPSVQELEGVVVTALGVTREKKALGYSVQDVKGGALQTDGSANVINQLSGRIAGVQVTASSGNMGGSSRILIRGINSISGNNQPLFVVDGTIIDNSDFNTYGTARGAGGYDYGNMAQDINPDDISSISVLKGANAAALYGSRAANGVILITTKKGAAQKGKTIGVEFSTGLSFEQVAYLPDYQNKYGGGNGGIGATWEVKTYTDNTGYYKVPGVDANGDAYQSFDLGNDYGIDESFGPAYTTKSGNYLKDPAGYGIDLTGTIYENQPLMYRPWNSFDKWDTENYGKSIEWKAPAHDVKDFFKTGIGWTNNVAFTGGSDKATVRLGLGTFNSTGYMPESTQDKYTVNLSATANLTKDFKAFGEVNYITTKTKGRPETGYGDVNPVERFNQWGQRQLDMNVQKSYINPDGTQRSWNRTSMDDPTPAYSNNPYWDRNMNYQNDKRDRYYGNVGLSWQITSWLRAQGKFNLDNYTFRTQERVAIGSASQSFYREQIRQNSELNAEFLFLVDKTFAKDWRLTANFGGNMMDRNYKLNSGSTVGGLIIPELYTLSNSFTNVASDYKSWKRINSLYAQASLGWKSMVYVDLTAREDWSSTLKNTPNYFYPSVSVSWVVSELPAIKEAKWLTFAKLRGGWAKAGNDGLPYQTSLTYANFLDPNGYPYHFPPNALYTLPTTLNNPNLVNEMTTSWELGAEIRVFDNRLGLDFTYYSKKSVNQIIPVAISGATGYSFELLNAGEITNKGYEIFLTAIPVRVKKDFEWTFTANFARNRNMVVDIAPGIDNLQLGVGPFNISVNAAVGQEYGQLMGTDFVYDENGNKVVGTNGRYLKSAVKALGTVLPDWNMGVGNEFKIFGFDVRVLVDIQHGGSFFSTTKMWGTYTGILAASAENGIRENGVVIDATVAKYDPVTGLVMYNADGTAQVTGKNTTNIPAYTWTTDHYNGPAAQNILDASYVKLREITVSYTIPAKLTGPINNLKIGLFGRNLATFGTAMKGIDPEQNNSSGNIQGIEGAGLPSLRTFGFNVGFNF